MKKTSPNDSDIGENQSAKRNAIVAAALELFTRYGYRKTSIDEIAEAAQVAKRTVYLHFENKAAVFVAILEHLADQVRLRCAAAEDKSGSATDRLAALLDAYFGMKFELFGTSEHMPELAETFSELTQARIWQLNAEYEKRLAKFLRSTKETGETGGPPPGLTLEQIVDILLRGAAAAKHDPKIRGDVTALQARLRELAVLVIAAMKK